MQTAFLDTNIFLRHLLNDEPVQSPACHELFRRIERGELVGWTTVLVVAEIVFVLSNAKTYAVPRSTLQATVLPLLKLANLKIERKNLYPRAFELFVSHPIDYIGAYHATLVEKAGEDTVFSYDKDFDRIPTISRREP